MHSVGTSWAIIWRMAIWNLSLGAVLGLLYGPVAQLALVAIQVRERILQGRSDAYTVDPGTLFLALILASLVGIASCALIGLLSGILAGVPIIVIFRGTSRRFSNPPHQRQFANAISASIGGLIGLIVLILINLPSTLAYLGADWVMLGWILEVAIPTLLISGMVCWVSDRVVTWIVATRAAPML
jgi:hypothetical protein